MTDDVKQPRRFQIVYVMLVLLVLVLIVTTVVFILQLGGNATLNAQEQSAKLTACARQVASDYEEARDDFLLALGTEQIAVARAGLDHLYYPKGRDHAKVTRAQRTKQICGG